MQQGNNKVSHFGFRDSALLLALLATGHAVCFTPFLRKGFGVEAFRTRGVVGLVMILLFGGTQGAEAMFWFFGAWSLALAIQHSAAMRAERRGEHVHSQYQGTSLLAGKLWITDRAAKYAIEPVLCFVVGALLCPFSEALGGFVMLGFLSLMIQRAMEIQLWTNRARRMRDAAIEQRYLAGLYRGEEI
jgi:hypothetical protein